MVNEEAVKAAVHTVRLCSWGHMSPEEATRQVIEEITPLIRAEALLEAADEFAKYSKNVTNNNTILNPLWEGLADGWKRASDNLRARAVRERGEE